MSKRSPQFGKCIVIPPIGYNTRNVKSSKPFMQRVEDNTPTNKAEIRGQQDLVGVRVSVEACLSYLSKLGLKIITAEQIRKNLESRGATVVD